MTSIMLVTRSGVTTEVGYRIAIPSSHRAITSSTIISLMASSCGWQRCFARSVSIFSLIMKVFVDQHRKRHCPNTVASTVESHEQYIHLRADFDFSNWTEIQALLTSDDHSRLRTFSRLASNTRTGGLDPFRSSSDDDRSGLM